MWKEISRSYVKEEDERIELSCAIVVGSRDEATFVEFLIFTNIEFDSNL